MKSLEQRAEQALGQWADDPRSLAGAQALGMLENKAEVSNQYASRDYQFSDLDDPRVVAARAAVVEARRPDRLFMPGANLEHQLEKGVKYSL